MRLFLLLLGVVIAGPSYAITDSSATVTGTASNVLAAGSSVQPRINIHIVNRSTDNIWCSWTATATVGGAGTFPLLGQGATVVYAAPQLVPQGALSCISSGSSSGLTVLVTP